MLNGPIASGNWNRWLLKSTVTRIIDFNYCSNGLSYVLTSNVFCYRKICWCKLKYMVKFHWQIHRAILNELSKICSCKWRTLTKWFDNSLNVGAENVTNYLLVCWHLTKMRNTINTLCLLYKVFKTNVMCGTRRPKSIRTARKKWE